MFKRKNILKKKLWGFADFKITKDCNEKIEIYEEIFNLNFDIEELQDKLAGIITTEEKTKIFWDIKVKKDKIGKLEKNLQKSN